MVDKTISLQILVLTKPFVTVMSAPASLATASTDGNVAERAAFGPVSTATFAEVSRLRQAVVVVVTKLGVGRCTARTRWSSLVVSVGNLPLLGNFELWRWELVLVAVVCVIRQHHCFGLGKWSLGVD